IVPTFWISISNVLSNIQDYGVPHCGPWLPVALRVLFWVYLTCTFTTAVGQYFFLFTGKPLTLQSITLAWILPIFPVILCGTLASLISPSQPPEQALPILIAGITFQGVGMLIAAFMYSAYLGRLMSQGLPSPNTRPAMFVAVGPPSFTGLALLGIPQDLTRIYPKYASITYIVNPAVISDIFRIIALSAAIFLWATSFWFFCIALVSVIDGALGRRKGRDLGMSFHLVWWAFVSPNVGFTICTIAIGKVLTSDGILWVGTAMAIVLVITWFYVSVMYTRAIDEDHDQRAESWNLG
ncbi:C4-dicarboxylate transporter/malic acid transport protein, partial [Tothia fuscella]